MGKKKLISKYETFTKRIDFRGNLNRIYEQVCKDFQIGNLKSAEIIKQGYEDLNVKLSTERGYYFLKMFAKVREGREPDRIVDTILRLQKIGVSTPRLYKSVNGYLDVLKFGKRRVSVCVMEFIKGKTLYELRERPTAREIKKLAGYAARINSTNIKPLGPVMDSWSIINFPYIFKQRSRYLSDKDALLLGPIWELYSKIDLKKLPNSFIHGDIMSTNVIKGDDKNLYIVDFSVSNYLPRIFELALLACDILQSPNSKETTNRNIRIAVNEYQKKIKLTNRELDALHKCIRLISAIQVINSNYYMKMGLDAEGSKEMGYWLKKGRIGLRQTQM